jgi:uncharacterized protein (DUF488 family)
MEQGARMFTIGHSTHPAERFVDLLGAHRIELVCDVRRYPGSRRHPQFNAGSLTKTLHDAGIAYAGLGDELGGRRRARRDSPTMTGWRNASFRAYADHMQTREFAAGFARLEELALERRTVIMCAEGDWRRCHRRLISDALAAKGWRVLHIRPDEGVEEHQPTVFG